MGGSQPIVARMPVKIHIPTITQVIKLAKNTTTTICSRQRHNAQILKCLKLLWRVGVTWGYL